MSKKNCWDHFQCGRQPGGEKTGELGTCPAALQNTLNDLNGGVNGGRVCWAIAGTLCKGKTQGTYAQKLGDCLQCDFYTTVRKEQGQNFVTSKEILKKLYES